MLEYLASVWKPLLEIVILWYAFYLVLIFVKETRAFQVLKGLIVLIIIVVITTTFLSQRMGLYILNWIIENFFALLVLAFLIIFQPELRQGLARIGQQGMLSAFFIEEHIIEEIVNTSFLLAKRRVGAIIAIERQNSLTPYMESGITLDSNVTQELLTTIFIPNTPLHDGGVIIRGERITTAGCLFPLSENPRISRSLGTRHRAAIGLTEETDAIVVVISEETGAVSIAINGRLTRDLDKDGLERALKNLCGPVRRKKRSGLIKIFKGKKK
ncbi:MAG: TIGR00159 family protein [Candidatus Omnitrophica bacterium]|nr:TIGR00159 family protein [Candidatus Omnitrophota bacterium]